MNQVLTYLTEVDGVDYEVEFTTYFTATHIIAVKIDSVTSIRMYASDSKVWTKLAITSLDKALMSEFIKQAELMA